MKKKSHKNWTNKEVQKAIRLRKSGWTLAIIAHVLERPYWSVVCKLYEQGTYREERGRI